MLVSVFNEPARRRELWQPLPEFRQKTDLSDGSVVYCSLCLRGFDFFCCLGDRDGLGWVGFWTVGGLRAACGGAAGANFVDWLFNTPGSTWEQDLWHEHVEVL